MNETLKANIQSVIRALLNLFAGANIISQDSMSRYEGIAAAGVAVIWTIYDNWNRKNPPPPPTRITTTLGLFLIVLFVSGCAINRPAFVEETYKDGKLESKRTLKVTSYALWPATQEIGKQKVGMGKTFSVGSEGIKEDGGGTNVIGALRELNSLLGNLR